MWILAAVALVYVGWRVLCAAERRARAIARDAEVYDVELARSVDRHPSGRAR